MSKKKKGINYSSMKCPYCGSTVEFRSADGIYKNNSKGAMLYVCRRYPECDAYVSVHEGTRVPMGLMADGHLRRLRIEAHRAFDNHTMADPTVKINTDAIFAVTTPENGTAVCGSYPPNAFGLYDMHGNVYDFCLDWYKEDILSLGGAVNVEDGVISTASGHEGKRSIVRKGGNWGQNNTAMLRAADRQYDPSTARNVYDGFRLICTAGLK